MSLNVNCEINFLSGASPDVLNSKIEIHVLMV